MISAGFSFRRFFVFQAAGLLFCALFAADQLYILLANFVDDSYVRNIVLEILISCYNLSNTLQAYLSASFDRVLFAGILSIGLVFVTIFGLTLAKRQPAIFFRAIFFLLLGIIAIPVVLFIYTMVWVSIDVFYWIYDLVSSIFSWIEGVVQAVYGFIFGLILEYKNTAVTVTLLLAIFFSKHRARIIVFLGFVAFMLIVVLYAFPEALSVAQMIVREIGDVLAVVFYYAGVVLSAIWNVIYNILYYPLIALGYVFSFIVTAAGFLFVALIAAVVFCLVNGQAGHMLVDTLFDAGNVQQDARAAGRFLIGVGFIVSVVLLTLVNNAVAQEGALSAIRMFGEMLGSQVLADDMLLQRVVDTYLLLVPDAVEAPIVKAFGYGYPPAIDLLLLIAASVLSSVLIAAQVFRKGRPGDIGVAFFPSELLIVLLGAAAIILYVLSGAFLQGDE